MPGKQFRANKFGFCFFLALFFPLKKTVFLSFAVFAASQLERKSSVCLDLDQQISLNPLFCFCFFTVFVLTETEWLLPYQSLVVYAFISFKLPDFYLESPQHEGKKCQCCIYIKIWTQQMTEWWVCGGKKNCKLNGTDTFAFLAPL